MPDGCAASARELGRVVTACAEGDLREGTDFRVTRMEGKEDEARIADSPPDAVWVVFPRDREIIPLENLVAWGRRILVVARTPADVSLYRGVLEKGVYGLVLDCPGSRGDAGAGRRRPREGGGRSAGSRAGGRGRPSRDGRPRLRGHVHLDRGEPRDAGRERERGDVPRVRRERPEPVCPSAAVPRQRGRGPFLLPRPRGPHRLSLRAGRRVRECSSSTTPGGERRRGSAGRRWSGARWCWSAPSALPGTSIRSSCRTPRRSGSWGRGASRTSIARIAAGDEVLLLEERAGRHFGVAVEETIREK